MQAGRLSTVEDFYEREKAFEENHKLNQDHFRGKFTACMLPLSDLTNHHHPRNVQREDSISFNIKAIIKNQN